MRGGMVHALRQVMTPTKIHFTYRIDRWTADGTGIVEHVACADDLTVAAAAFDAATRRWEGEPITLREGARVIEGSRQNKAP